MGPVAEAAWQKAQAAWEAAGKQTPCYDPAYMDARAELAAAIQAEMRMTTDPEEGRRQIEAMKPEPLKVGDKVRLKAGTQVMRVVQLEDYGNMVDCNWFEDGDVACSDTFPAASLVRVDK